MLALQVHYSWGLESSLKKKKKNDFDSYKIREDILSIFMTASSQEYIF